MRLIGRVSADPATAQLTTTFNGLRLPSIGICKAGNASGENRFRLLREFGYADFRNRLS